MNGATRARAVPRHVLIRPVIGRPSICRDKCVQCGIIHEAHWKGLEWWKDGWGEEPHGEWGRSDTTCLLLKLIRATNFKYRLILSTDPIH